MIISCDKVTAEAKRIVNVCNEVETNMDYSAKDEVVKLLMIVKAKEPCYTAAGYFILNRSTLFALLNVVTTYFIILLQFYQQNNISRTKKVNFTGITNSTK